MAIRYRITKGRNPKTGQTGFRPVPVVRETVDRRRLVHLLSKKTTVSSGDVGAVLAELADLINEELMQGRPVTLDGIGTFYVTIRGGLKDSPEGFRPFNRPGTPTIRFRTARELLRHRGMFEFVLDDGVGGNGEAAAPSAGSGASEPASDAGDEPGKDAE